MLMAWLQLVDVVVTYNTVAVAVVVVVLQFPSSDQESGRDTVHAHGPLSSFFLVFPFLTCAVSPQP